jgi:hypothetical protein
VLEHVSLEDCCDTQRKHDRRQPGRGAMYRLRPLRWSFGRRHAMRPRASASPRHISTSASNTPDFDDVNCLSDIEQTRDSKCTLFCVRAPKLAAGCWQSRRMGSRNLRLRKVQRLQADRPTRLESHTTRKDILLLSHSSVVSHCSTTPLPTASAAQSPGFGFGTAAHEMKGRRCGSGLAGSEGRADRRRAEYLERRCVHLTILAN